MTPNLLDAIVFRWSFSALFTLWLFVPSAQAQSAATVINGVYNGTYTCAMGPRTLKLSLLASDDGSLTGVFTFYLPPTSHAQAFSYSLNGTLDAASGKFRLIPVKWETPPPAGYTMVGMDGAFNPGAGQVTAGKITYASCGAFQARRDKAETASIASVAPHKAAEAARPPQRTPAAPAQPPPAKAAASAPQSPTPLAAAARKSAAAPPTEAKDIVSNSKASWGEPACQLISKSSLESILGFQYSAPKIVPVDTTAMSLVRMSTKAAKTYSTPSTRLRPTRAVWWNSVAPACQAFCEPSSATLLDRQSSPLVPPSPHAG